MKKFIVPGHASSFLPEDGEWKLIFSDEFDGKNGEKPDPTKWLYRTKFWGYDSNTFIGEEGVEMDGKSNLLFKLIEKNGNYYSSHLQTGTNAFDYMIRSGVNEKNPWGQSPFFPLQDLPKPTFMHKYGYYEVRCKFQKQLGWWSAFWLQSPSIGTTADGRYSGVECDIFECFHGDTKEITSGCIYGGYSRDFREFTRIKYIPEDTHDETFHTIGMEWSEDGYVYYCDGKETARGNETVSHVEQFILLSTECQGYRYGNLDKPDEKLKNIILPDYFTVDYVRVFDRIK